MQTSIQDLCQDVPEEIMYMLNYTKSLKFDQAPDYQVYKDSFC